MPAPAMRPLPRIVTAEEVFRLALPPNDPVTGFLAALADDAELLRKATDAARLGGGHPPCIED